jgi:hypothetical protein
MKKNLLPPNSPNDIQHNRSKQPTESKPALVIGFLALYGRFYLIGYAIYLYDGIVQHALSE